MIMFLIALKIILNQYNKKSILHSFLFVAANYC